MVLYNVNVTGWEKHIRTATLNPNPPRVHIGMFRETFKPFLSTLFSKTALSLFQSIINSSLVHAVYFKSLFSYWLPKGALQNLLNVLGDDLLKVISVGLLHFFNAFGSKLSLIQISWDCLVKLEMPWFFPQCLQYIDVWCKEKGQLCMKNEPTTSPPPPERKEKWNILSMD